ncbi:hypothetical protein [Haloferula sp. A504]|uniref:hypothetical protein n=1 Tax=Haloferula sp. A504 TaxID=3373601 RepID=UPI0031C4BB3F|nr:hypothetical protein [Verrucomicrobiaceae bacterium E54]
MRSAILALLAALSASSAHAAITYVDAAGGAGGNTVNASGGSATDWYGTTSGSDTLWTERGFATNSTVYEALTATNNGSVGGLPKLKTTITGLDSGETYNVWVFFVDNTGDDATPIQNWSIGASLTATVDTTYWSQVQPLGTHNSATPVVGTNGSGTVTSIGVLEASSLDFVVDPVFTENLGLVSERRLFGVNLGQVSGSTTADVYIQQLIETNSSESRTWYDGVGYELVPEPSIALLGSLGLLALLRRRRA